MPAYYQRLTIDENDEPILVFVLRPCHDGDKDLNDKADMTPEERCIDDLTTPSPGTGITYGELALFVVWVVLIFLVNCLLGFYK